MENALNDQILTEHVEDATTTSEEKRHVPEEEREEREEGIIEERPAVPQIPYTAAPTAASVAFPQHAYCTLVTSNDYAPGALVLAHALRNIHGTSRLLACMVTPGLDTQIIARLRQVYHHIHFVDPLDSYDAAALSLLGRPELGITLTKVNVWRLTQYDRVVFFDADTFPLRHVDELFDRDIGDGIAAAADIGWPDCFNSGVFVCRPSLRTYRALLHTMASHGSFDGGDQGLLNTHFSDWSTGNSQSRLPFIYNVTPTAWYSYAPAFARYKKDIAVIHFIGRNKPWQWSRDTSGQLKGENDETDEKYTRPYRLVDFVRLWWNVHDNHVELWTPERGAFYRTIQLAYSLLPEHGVSARSMEVYSGQPMQPQIRREFSDYRVNWSQETSFETPTDYTMPYTSYYEGSPPPPSANTDNHVENTESNNYDIPMSNFTSTPPPSQNYHHHHHHHHQEQHNHDSVVEAPLSDVMSQQNWQQYTNDSTNTMVYDNIPTVVSIMPEVVIPTVIDTVTVDDDSAKASCGINTSKTTTTSSATRQTIEIPDIGPRVELKEPYNWVDWAHQMINDLYCIEGIINKKQSRYQENVRKITTTTTTTTATTTSDNKNSSSNGASNGISSSNSGIATTTIITEEYEEEQQQKEEEEYVLMTTFLNGLKKWERELLLIEHLGFRRALTLRGEDGHTAQMAVRLARGNSTRGAAGTEEEVGRTSS